MNYDNDEGVVDSKEDNDIYNGGSWKMVKLGTNLHLKKWNDTRSTIKTTGKAGFIDTLAVLHNKVNVDFGEHTPYVALDMAKSSNVSFLLQIDDEEPVELHDGVRSGVDPERVHYNEEKIGSPGYLKINKLNFTFTIQGTGNVKYNQSFFISIDSLINSRVIARSDKFRKLTIGHDLFDPNDYEHLQVNRLPASRIVFSLNVDYQRNSIIVTGVDLITYYDLPLEYPEGSFTFENYINVTKNPTDVYNIMTPHRVSSTDVDAISEIHKTIQTKLDKLSRKVPGFKFAYARTIDNNAELSGNLPHFPFGELTDIPVALSIAILLQNHPEDIFDDPTLIKNVLTTKSRENDPRGHALWYALERLFREKNLTLRHLITHSTGLVQSLPAAIFETTIQTARATIRDLTTPTTFFLDIDRSKERKEEEELALIRELNMMTPFTNALPFPFNVDGPKSFDYAILAMFIEHLPEVERYGTYAQQIVTKVLFKNKLIPNEDALIWNAHFNESSSALEEGELSIFKFGQHAFSSPAVLNGLISKLPDYRKFAKEIYSNPVFDENNALKMGFRNLLWSGFYSKHGVAVLFKEGGFPITGNSAAVAIMIPQLKYSAVVATRYEMMGVLYDVRRFLVRILRNYIPRIANIHPPIPDSKVPLITEHPGDIHTWATNIFQERTGAEISKVLPVGTVYTSPFVQPLTGVNDSFTIQSNKDYPTSRVDLVSNHNNKIMATIMINNQNKTFHQLSAIEQPDIGHMIYPAAVDIDAKRAVIGDNIFYTNIERHPDLEQIKQVVLDHEAKLINMPIGLYSASSSSVPNKVPLSVLGAHTNQDYTSVLIGCHNTTGGKKRHHVIHSTSKRLYN